MIRADEALGDCPLCQGPAWPFARVGAQAYGRCGRCELTWLAPGQRPAQGRERAEYLLHCNDADDPGYRRFLGRLAAPLLDRLAGRSQVLDFGCGPGPALAAILREAGHEVAVHDPWFAPYQAVLARRYDAVTCTEVVEHLHEPAKAMASVRSLLRPGGILAVMTSMLDDGIDFQRWHYRRDCTHVAFWRPRSFEWLARGWGWRCEPVAPGVVFLHAPADTTARR
ncbi:MAG: class I SAM-dependent methyltransferase [Xanthomonadales bacterium]|nr:class I SAM-dependent methyltransferase [Xanthomonadales bacterium]